MDRRMDTQIPYKMTKWITPLPYTGKVIYTKVERVGVH